ncbi:hypothetical protein AB0G20_20210 [Streptomyces sp. NPDC024017]|uniref:hypothetical protein n=1 Tax=Streptomyces sp. NPDC024017 TaxID=3154326 RepID=UPI0033CE78D3
MLNPFQGEPAAGVAEPSGDDVTATATRVAQQSTVRGFRPRGELLPATVVLAVS